MAVMEPASLQLIPVQAVGQAFAVAEREAVLFHVRRTLPKGSCWIPFLNSSRDRSSASEAEEARRSTETKWREKRREGWKWRFI